MVATWTRKPAYLDMLGLLHFMWQIATCTFSNNPGPLSFQAVCSLMRRRPEPNRSHNSYQPHHNQSISWNMALSPNVNSRWKRTIMVITWSYAGARHQKLFDFMFPTWHLLWVSTSALEWEQIYRLLHPETRTSLLVYLHPTRRYW